MARPASAQWFKIKGTVYDSSRNYAIELVTVLSTSGKGAFTNADGHYEIDVAEKDSIWFSYLGKPTKKFPVLKIANPFAFDISLQINVTVLKEVKVRQRNYKQDSAQNREDYAKVFNYRKPGLRPSVTNMGVGFDVNEIINMFRFKKNRSMLSFQRRLLQEERDKFVDHRFSKALVRRLTGLTGNELDSFMHVFRPPYEFTMLTNDYDFQEYIKDSYRRFLVGLPPLPMPVFKPEEEDQ
ncbi:MAG: carboxypeptidase-like regulatory domain-containing protein [Bacteroidota bacterium]